MKELIGALIKAREGFGRIVKNKVNPFHKSKYAPLDSVLEATEESLSRHGLTIVQSIELVESVFSEMSEISKMGETTRTETTRSHKAVLVTALYHTSGECLTSRYPLPSTEDPQKLGAALTYARRYAVCALLSVTADEDDDGNSAKSKPKEKDVEGDAKAAKVSAAMPEGMKNAEVLAIIQKKWGSSITTPRQLTHEKVDELVSLIQSQAA